MNKFTEELGDKARAAEQAQLTDKGAATPDSIRRLKRELRFMFRKLEDAERTLEREGERSREPHTPTQPLAPTCT